MMRTFAAENFSDIRDLTRLYERMSGWDEIAYLRFLSVYPDEKNDNAKSQRLWERIQDRINRKNETPIERH
jgi:hypothetical protein